ncbi:MAG: hypothetical protein WCG23_00110 [bacterium]
MKKIILIFCLIIIGQSVQASNWIEFTFNNKPLLIDDESIRIKGNIIYYWIKSPEYKAYMASDITTNTVAYLGIIKTNNPSEKQYFDKNNIKFEKAVPDTIEEIANNYVSNITKPCKDAYLKFVDSYKAGNMQEAENNLRIALQEAEIIKEKYNNNSFLISISKSLAQFYEEINKYRYSMYLYKYIADNGKLNSSDLLSMEYKIKDLDAKFKEQATNFIYEKQASIEKEREQAEQARLQQQQQAQLEVSRKQQQKENLYKGINQGLGLIPLLLLH